MRLARRAALAGITVSTRLVAWPASKGTERVQVIVWLTGAQNQLFAFNEKKLTPGGRISVRVISPVVLPCP